MMKHKIRFVKFDGYATPIPIAQFGWGGDEAAEVCEKSVAEIRRFFIEKNPTFWFRVLVDIDTETAHVHSEPAPA